MPRALAMRRFARANVPQQQIVATARARRAIAEAQAVHYWLFTDAHDQGAVTEFVEAADAERLEAALTLLSAVPGSFDEGVFTRSTEFVLD
jgi:hypothetical protein